ncbi:signal transduction histidine kinase [Kitasatospora sp. MAA4]|uniref:sensor histidine kinase n=1 Tax=Kitasatospora sp. MAA4 TaxID=3035093 RepID=UPI0024766E99|nr:histidine kinase [Kitasatospora sp. MAA4]MDH6135771.1 signal transduction histidine kinase [Kitasatospora sp. MAA4]
MNTAATAISGTPEVIAPRVARGVVAVVTGGFFFGGFDGLLTGTPTVRHQGLGVLLLVAILLLHLYNCVRRVDGRRPRAWWLTLAAQAVLTWLPMGWFETTWYGNPGFLAGAVLLLVRRRSVAWLLFALVVLADVPPALDIRRTTEEGLYLVVGQTLLVGITVYVLGRLADLVARLAGAREQLARLAVAAERVRFDRDLDERVARVLSTMRGACESAVARLTRDPGDAEAVPLLAEVQQLAGRANDDMRAVSAARRDPLAVARIADVRDPEVALLGALTLVLMIVPLPLREELRIGGSTPALGGFVLLLAAFTAGYLWFCARTAEHRSTVGYRLALGALVVAGYAAIPLFGPAQWCVRMYLAGLVLVALRGPLRWVVTVLLLVQEAPFGVWGWGAWNIVYNVVWMAERAAIVFAVVRMAQLVAAVRRAEGEVVRAQVGAERLRFARDLHDLLGYTLSTIGLKSELAAKLITRRPQRAVGEAAACLELIDQALTDVEAVSSGYRDLSLAEEIRSVRCTLDAAGVENYLVNDLVEPPAELDTALATVLREAVNNILRHSAARRCSVEITELDGVVRLTVQNDGASLPVTPATDPHGGSGLGNLRQRLERLGGELAVTTGRGQFRLVADVPLAAHAEAAGGITGDTVA